MKRHAWHSGLAFFAFVSLALAESGAPSSAATNATPWPVELSLPGETPRRDGASLQAWVPPGAARIRAVLAIAANTDSVLFGEHPPLRAVAAKHAMAVVHLKHAPHARINDPGNPSALSRELCPYCEYLWNWNEYGQWFCRKNCQPVNGAMPLPPGPGLGLELDDDRIETREDL